MKLEGCKVGMKVKALRQGVKSNMDWAYFLDHNPGRIATITEIGTLKYEVQLSKFSWFTPEDLEPYIEPEETEYRQLKDIIPRAIYRARLFGEQDLDLFMQEFIRFVLYFELDYEDVLPFSDLTWELENEPEWEKWLIEHGFIEKVVPEPEEITYAQGDELVDDNGVKAILAQVGTGRMAIIPLDGVDKGNRWCPIVVDRVSKVTAEEFKEMNGRTGTWRKDK